MNRETTVPEEAVEAAREALIESVDVVPCGEEPFTGWSLILAERTLQAALPAIAAHLRSEWEKQAVRPEAVEAAYHAYHTVATPTQPQMRLAIRTALSTTGGSDAG